MAFPCIVNVFKSAPDCWQILTTWYVRHTSFSLGSCSLFPPHFPNKRGFLPSAVQASFFELVHEFVLRPLEYWTELRSITEESVSCCWYVSCHVLLIPFLFGDLIHEIRAFCCSFSPIIQSRNIAWSALFTAASPFYPLERLTMSVHAFLGWCLTWKSRCL